MKKLIPFLFTIIISFSVKAQLTDVIPLGSLSKAEVEALAADLGVPPFLITVETGVDMFRLIYETPDPQGNMTIASGALIVPQEITCAVPLASYQHGTMAHKMDAPSFNPTGERSVGILFASTGYAVALPDHLGLGASPGLHPYVHAKSEATSVVDMLRASRMYATDNDIYLNDQVMLFGYSQGGHSTMAAHKEIQENHSEEFDIVVSVPMSGPYDVSGVQTSVIIEDVVYPTPGYLPYVLFAYNSVYGNLFSDPSEIFQPPYDEILPPLFDGTHSMGEINNACPDIPNQVLVPAVLDSFKTDPNHRFWAALRDNDLYDWTPEAPVRMMYCTGDDQVNYMNSIVALDQFIANGATDVEANDLGTGDHGECYFPAVIRSKILFDSYRVLDNGISVVETITDDLNGDENGSIVLEISGGIGDLIYEWSNGVTTKDNFNLGAGNYGVTITDSAGCLQTYFYAINTPTSILETANQFLPLQISPNPANGVVNLKLPNPTEIYDLEVVSISGQIILQKQKISGDSYQIEQGSLPKGMHLITLKGNQNYRSKLIYF